MKATIILSLCLAISGCQVAGQTTCPGLYLPVGNGCYTFAEVHYSWLEANLFCEYSGGYLAKVDSIEKQTALKFYYDQHLAGSGNYWIGASDSLADASWRWIPSGQAVIYENWQSGYPTASSTEDCAYWDPAVDFWRSSDCCSINFFRPICEINPI